MVSLGFGSRRSERVSGSFHQTSELFFAPSQRRCKSKHVPPGEENVHMNEGHGLKKHTTILNARENTHSLFNAKECMVRVDNRP